MMSKLPSDLIVHLAQFFSSGVDLLSYSLTCQRFNQLILAKIRDNDKQALLKLHTRRVIQLNRISSNAEVYDMLPNHARHGKATGWSMRESTRDKIASLAQYEPIWNTSALRFASSTLSLPIHIVTPSIQAQVMTILEQEGLIYYEMENMCFGKAEGIQKQYNVLWEERCSRLDSERAMSNNKWHGESIYYTKSSNWQRSEPDIKERTNYVNGTRQGIAIEYRGNRMVRKCNYKDDQVSGEIEQYEYEPDCEHPILVQRHHVSKGVPEGTWERWEPKTGIRIRFRVYNKYYDLQHEERWWGDGTTRPSSFKPKKSCCLS